MRGVAAAGSALLGLLVGSFLNVVIHRVPRKESVLRPRSRCPQCGVELSERDNIPVLSWLLLRGRCRTCGAPISGRYPLVELLTAALSAAMGWRFGADWPLPAFLVLVWVLVAVSFIDIEHYLIPNKIVLAALALGVPLLVAAALTDDGRVRDLADALLGAVIACGALLVLALLVPRGMGMGDVKLALVLGLYLGWLSLGHVGLGLFLGFLAGAVGGIVLMVVGRRTRKDHIPFGPYLALGAYAAVLWGRDILDWYSGTS